MESKELDKEILQICTEKINQNTKCIKKKFKEKNKKNKNLIYNQVNKIEEKILLYYNDQKDLKNNFNKRCDNLDIKKLEQNDIELIDFNLNNLTNSIKKYEL